MIKKNYLTYVHNLRGLAILIIVAIHARMAAYGGDQDIGANKVLMILLDNGTIIFVFISGFLFQHVFASNLKYKKYLSNKLKFVLLPYALASILPIVDKLYFDVNIPWMTTKLESLNNFEFIGYMLATGKHFGPYWFIPMITIFYLLAPVLVILNNRKFYVFIFPIVFIIGLFTYQFGYYSTIIDSFIFYLPIYLFGMILSEYKSELFKYQNLVFPLLLIVYIGLLSLELSEVLSTPKFIGFNNSSMPYFIFNPSKLRFTVLSVILLILFNKYGYLKFRLLRVLGDYSFGIYFLHLYIIIIIQRLAVYFGFQLGKDFVSFIILTTVSITFSMLMVWVIKKIFKDRSRLIIGS